MVSPQTVRELSSCEFNDFVKGGIVLVDFFAEWCMNCLMLDPILEDICDKFGDKIRIGKMNIEENKKLADIFNVQKTPSIFIFREGRLIENLHGNISGEEIEERITALTEKL